MMKRIISIDIARGIAVILMLQSHLVLALGPIYPFNFFGSLSMFAAPFFLIIAGISYEFFKSARYKKGVKTNFVFLELFSRSVVLYIISILGLLIGNIFWPELYKFYFFVWSLIQLIAFSYILCFFIPHSVGYRITTILVLFCIKALIVLYYPLQFNFLIHGDCPIIPWLSYFIFGTIIYSFLYDKSINNYKLIISILYFTITLIILNIFNIKTGYSLRDELPTFILISSSQLLILVLLVVFVDNSNHGLLFLNPIKNVGKIAFSFYYLHMGLIFLLEKSFSALPILMPPKFANILVFIAIILITNYLEMFWEKFEYILGAEWILRKGTDIIAEFAKRLIKSEV